MDARFTALGRGFTSISSTAALALLAGGWVGAAWWHWGVAHALGLQTGRAGDGGAAFVVGAAEVVNQGFFGFGEGVVADGPGAAQQEIHVKPVAHQAHQHVGVGLRHVALVSRPHGNGQPRNQRRRHLADADALALVAQAMTHQIAQVPAPLAFD